MRRVGAARSDRPDLLARVPWGVFSIETSSAAVIRDPVEQLKELADLYRRGLLSREQFVSQRAKVLEW